jgi:hypothetical protein
VLADGQQKLYSGFLPDRVTPVLHRISPETQPRKADGGKAARFLRAEVVIDHLLVTPRTNLRECVD